MTKRTREFVEHVRQDCKNNGVRLIVTRYKRILEPGSGYYSGSFAEEPVPTLHIAGKQMFFLDVLVHEYSHMQQWKEQAPCWTQTTVDGVDAWEITNGWLAGLEVNQETLGEAYKIVIRCERDCDMRAVKTIKKWKLPVNLDLYIRSANAYHYGHHVMRDTRKWINAGILGHNKKILKACPNTFSTRPIQGCPKKVYEIIKQEVFKS